MISLDDAQAASDPRPVDLLALDEALEKLAEIDPRKARAMELKFFGGLSMAEIGSHLGISVKTVEVHKANAMRKLNFGSRADVVRYGVIQGWLQDP